MTGRTAVTRTRVRFGETDAAGIVFYPTFFVWFDLGTTALLRSAATESLRLGDGHPRWPLPIVESGARFSAPLYFDDPIAIRSSVVEIGTRSLRVEHVILRGETEVARGFEVRVFIAVGEGGAIASEPLPDELRASLSAAITVDDRD
ncbi:4-hydroxybenzoyl-CoA thioesterase [Vulcanimicrobium alpinum]|uniref:4-hydroxybenzoyl-CoA thioesterase n=1 Tax=Vulcanimicrobium alpinum TaxID=3016050 RepID=A0AAN2C7I6_UNVUL|nr:thioesterase family protein [Vulcanimicrobium alpinum]BDE04950.1 4-hydroxybenzoyl-CoA thioesterase [Vulcanimicrobium alpinum]